MGMKKNLMKASVNQTDRNINIPQAFEAAGCVIYLLLVQGVFGFLLLLATLVGIQDALADAPGDRGHF